MIGDRSYRWAWRIATGTLRFKNLLEHVAGYTETMKKVSVATSNAILAATATVVAGRTITSGITNPDVPRVVSVTIGGTTADIAAGNVRITGTNIEGKVITEDLALADNQTGTVTGVKAFKTVTSIRFPVADGTGATIAVGTGAALGVNHRLSPGKTSIVVYQDNAIDGNIPTLQAAPSASTTDSALLELNTVTPATAPNGSTFLTILYWYHKTNVVAPNDSPDWSTSTSTSSTSTSTSTSSTSTSISTSSTSMSSTSSSTSSTSTSTTTLP